MAVKTWTGCTITWGTNTGYVPKIIEEIAFSVERGEYETTHFASTQPSGRNVGGREFAPAILCAVMWTLRVQFDPTLEIPLNSADVAETFTITPPTTVSSNTITFSGFITAFSAAAPLDGLPTGNLTIRTTGTMALPSS